MLETLLVILSWDLPRPEIAVEDDGDLNLEWSDIGAGVSINQSGIVNWAISEPRAHGTDIEELKKRLEEIHDRSRNPPAA